MKPAHGVPGELEAAVLAESGASLEDFARARLDGTRRAVRVFLADLAIEAHPLGLRVELRLPKGSYATVVMREFTKRSGERGRRALRTRRGVSAAEHAAPPDRAPHA